MIQTQLLQLDKPYQIISAGGQVGIQVATLIVTEEKQSEDGGYVIDTHSHPVVSYGLKEGLVEEFNYGGSSPDDMYKRNQRLQPEGAVWNKVEVRDIHVLGVAGAKNNMITINTFMLLIPSAAPFLPFERVWDEMTVSRISKLFFGFEQVGLSWVRYNLSPDNRYENFHSVHVRLDYSTTGIPLVRVILKHENEYDPYDSEISFRCRLFDPLADTDTSMRFDEQQQPRIDRCVKNIVQIMGELRTWVINPSEIKFSLYSGEKTDPLNDVVKQVVERVNKEYCSE